jgi:hypothetical protein
MKKDELYAKVKELKDLVENGPAHEVPAHEISDFVLLPGPISYSVEREGTVTLLEHILEEIEQLDND